MLTSVRRGTTLFVELSGRLDNHTTPSCEVELLPELTPEVRVMIVDLGRLDYMSSVGLRLVLMLAKRLKQRGGDLRLCNPQPYVREVFEVSGLLSVINMYDTTLQAQDDSPPVSQTPLIRSC